MPSQRTIVSLALMMALGAGCAHRQFQEIRDVEVLFQTAPQVPTSVNELSLRDQLEWEATPQLPAYDAHDREDYHLRLEEVVRWAMQLSPVVRVEAGGAVVASDNTFYDIQANEAAVEESLSLFDTNFETAFTGNMFNRPPEAFFGPGLIQPQERDELSFNFGWTRGTEWGGKTSLLFNPNPGYLFLPDSGATALNPRHIGELELSITQPLLKGAGRAVNLAPVEIRRINVTQSDWEFKQTLMSSLGSVVAAYWDLYAAHVAVEAIEEVLPLLVEIVRIQTEAFKAEWVTETEVAKAEAQLYEFRQERQSLRATMLEREQRLRNLVGLPPQDGRTFVPSTVPLEARLAIDPSDAILAALDNQPALVQQRLNIRLRTIDQMLAQNGRRLQLDVFALQRLNGIGDSLGDALDQMLTDGFVDWQLGASLTVPLGRRQANAALRAADLRLEKEQHLLDQQLLTVQHDIQSTLRSIEFAFRQYEQAVKWLESAQRWVNGAKLRYENPNPEAGGSNVLVTNLNEYLNSLRLRTDAATTRASLLADYNSELVRLEEQKGTLLKFFGVAWQRDPCRNAGEWTPEEFAEPGEPEFIESESIEPESGEPESGKPKSDKPESSEPESSDLQTFGPKLILKDYQEWPPLGIGQATRLGDH